MVSRVDGPGLMVSPMIGKKEEFWIPASLVPNCSISRAWSFRPRRVEGEGEARRAGEEDCGPPTILTIPCSIRATAGGVARLVLEARHAEGARISWRKEGERHKLEEGDRYRLSHTADSLCLVIAPCHPSDSGIYCCRLEHETNTCEARIPLLVVGNNGTGATQGNNTCGMSQTSEDEIVRQEAAHYAGRYLELEELGKGRFAKVRRARDRATGQEVALKQISRLRQSRSLTRAEYDFLRRTRQPNIVRAFALFENAPQPGIDTIVLELVEGPTLFAYLSEKTEYTESMVARYAAEILSALHWLHSRQRAHLDLKPENVLVDRKTAAAKLIDLGETVRAAPLDEVVPPADLEFAAPESVLGRPTGPYTDMWAAGVFIYVLISGLSPFLDDSIEETTANILKCDFCFPDEYFQRISNEAKNLLGRLLCLRGEERATAQLSLVSPWLKISIGATIPSSRMAAFIERRAHRCSKSRQDRNGTFPS